MEYCDEVLEVGRVIRQTVIVISQVVQMGTPKTAEGRPTVTLNDRPSVSFGAQGPGRTRSGC